MAEADPNTDGNYGKSTAGNNRKIHIVRQTLELHFLTLCGQLVPRRPQSTQEQLPKCRRCHA